jgi:Cof subfamily protein (haloacid dehalogenase superfamily)
MRYRMLALDLDGTLLDPDGELGEDVREAVAAARGAGMRVVFCTGRRFRTALPVLRALDAEGPVVVNNGAVVKEVETAKTLYHSYLPAGLYPEALALMREDGTPLVYVDTYHADTDIVTERGPNVHPYQAAYIEDHTEHCRFVDDLADAPREGVIMVSMMADDARLESLQERARRQLGRRLDVHVIFNKAYRGRILELFSPLSGKWSGLARVADAERIAPQEIAAIGDDANDVGMLRGAGLGIAMGNAVEAVQAAADRIVSSNAAGGVVEAIEQVLRER